MKPKFCHLVEKKDKMIKNPEASCFVYIYCLLPLLYICHLTLHNTIQSFNNLERNLKAYENCENRENFLLFQFFFYTSKTDFIFSVIS